VTRSGARGWSAIAVIGCLPLAACSTGFGAPTRHATANLQAVAFNIGTNLQLRDAIVALPDGATAAKGGVAYVELTAINIGTTADQLTSVSVAAAVATNAVPSGSETVPAATTTGPGSVRLTFALEPLAAELRAGDEVPVTLLFASAGSTSTLDLPVIAQANLGSFLPSAPPPVPVSSPPASAAPVSSPPASTGASPVTSAPVSSAPASPVASEPTSPVASAPISSAPASPISS
jgi:hypothetical protein